MLVHWLNPHLGVHTHPIDLADKRLSCINVMANDYTGEIHHSEIVNRQRKFCAWDHPCRGFTTGLGCIHGPRRSFCIHVTENLDRLTGQNTYRTGY